jgi:hypothetical protein
VSAASSACCSGLPARQCQRHYWGSPRRRPGSRRARRQRHPRTPPPPSSAWMTCPSGSSHCSTSTHDPAREEQARGYIYSSNHCAFPPNIFDFRKGLQKTTIGWIWRLTVSNCAHDVPRMALSSSRLAEVALLRATRMDARATVDGWYSTELITAHSRRDKRSVITAVGFD